MLQVTPRLLKSPLRGMPVTFLVVLAAFSPAFAEDVGPAFTYQGVLTQAGQPVDDTECSFLLRLYDDPKAGSVLAEEVESDIVIRGRFTVHPDFGQSVFVENQALWLEIGVCCADDPEECLIPASYTMRSPRQRVTATRSALQTGGILVEQNENVGIGASNPQADLHVRGNSPLGESMVRPGQADSSAQVRITDNASASRGAIMHSDGTDNQWQVRELNFDGETAPHLIIEHDSGDVAVGTTDPQAKLHIDGDLWVDEAIIRSPQATGTVHAYVRPWDWRCRTPEFTSRQNPGRMKLEGPRADGERWQAPVNAPPGAELLSFTVCRNCPGDSGGSGGEVRLFKYDYSSDSTFFIESSGSLCRKNQQCETTNPTSTLGADQIWYVQAIPPGNHQGNGGIRVLSVRVSYLSP